MLFNDKFILSQKGSITLENELKQIIQNFEKNGVEWLFDYIQNSLPEWIVERCQHYADEYKQLEINWNELCRLKLNESSKEIILVKYLPDIGLVPTGNEFNGFQILKTLCDLLTSKGFIIRSTKTFTSCGICKKVILTYQAHDYLQSTSMKHLKQPSPVIPLQWKETCLSCSTLVSR